MVSAASMSAMAIQAAVAFLFPLGLLAYYFRKEKLSVKPVLVGMLVFILFSQILEKSLHYFMLQANPETRALLANPWLFSVYGSLAAGIFEEIGRYLGFSVLLPRNRERRDGIALGIGHGGVESILIGGIAGIQSLTLASMLNKGALDQALAGKFPGDTLLQLKSQLIGTPFWMYLVGGFERVAAVLLHIALSLIVLHAVRRRRAVFLLAAVLIHAAVDFFPAMYQARLLSIWPAEIVLLAVAVCSIVLIARSGRWLGSD